MSDDRPLGKDVWAWGEDLAYAASSAALEGCDEPGFVPPPGFADASYRLARALGFIRLHGVDEGDDDSSLPPRVAVAAASRLAEYLRVWLERAHLAGEAWDAAVDEFESDAVVYDLLDADLEAWAVLEAVEEAYEESGDEAVFRSFEAAISAYEPWRDALWQERDLLSVVAGRPYLVNIRETLAAEARELAPWWLGPELDRAAAAVETKAYASIPRLLGAIQ